MQLHKTRVAADWTNLRAYYSEIQTDYIATGKANPKVPIDEWHTEITFLDGQTVKLKAGQIVIREPGDQMDMYMDIRFYITAMNI